MKERISKDMGLTLIMLSGIFLFNPIIAFIDVLPDAIGFLLLLGGLYRLSDMDEHLTAAQTRFRILFGASLGLLAATYMITGFMKGMEGEMNPYETPVTRLLFAFIQLVLYWVVVIPAFRQFFLGMDRLSERFGHVEIPRRHRKGKTEGERMFSATALFFAVNTLLALLPELSILTSFEFEAGNQVILFGFVKKMQFTFDWYDFVNLFRLLALLISLGFSLVWLFRFTGYCKHLKRDMPWIEGMKTHYREEILTRNTMFSLRRFSFSFILLYVGILFTFNIKVDYLSALPGLGFAFLTFAAVFFLGDLLPRQRECWWASVGLALISAAQIVLNRLYLKKYLPGDALFYEKAIWQYVLLSALEVLEAVATVVLLYYLLRVLNEIVLRYTGVNYRTVDENGQQLASRATQKLHRHFANRMKLVLAFFFIACVGNVAMTLSSLYAGWVWLIPFVFTTVGVFLYFSLQGEIWEEVKNHFSEE